ncbi:MAG: hypothetical protein KKB31_06835 [Nanoarchaeota archaeon]|nr:hypothetical protein [Nanoarchaeota archaeon]
MKSWLKYLLIGIVIFVLIIGLFFLYQLGFLIQNYDTKMFNKAIETGDVGYCHKIKDQGVAPGYYPSCVSLVAQKNNNPTICENLEERNSLSLEDCYSLYAYYKNDESLCVEPQCSKTLFNICIESGCETIKDYE